LDDGFAGAPFESTLRYSDYRQNAPAQDERVGTALEAPTLCLCDERPAPGSEKGAIVRRLRQEWRPGDILLFEDETIIRLFPPLRACWAMRGTQAVVPITGRNAKRTLFGVLNPRTGHRILMHAERCRQDDFQAFLCLLRHCYPGRKIWLLLDEAPGHTAYRSQELATELDIIFLWLPKQCSELNAMDQLWKELKSDLAANRQFKSIDEAIDYAEQWVLKLSSSQVLQKAGIFSKSYWLKHL
jgi:transposase